MDKNADSEVKRGQRQNQAGHRHLDRIATHVDQHVAHVLHQEMGTECARQQTEDDV